VFKNKVLLFLSVLFSIGLPITVQAMKPRPPLQLALSAVDLSEDKTQITLSATANTGNEGVELSLELPLGLLLLEGERTWAGPLNLGDTHTLVLIVQNDGTRTYTILAEAKVRLPNAGHFIQERPLVLNPSALDRSPLAPPIRQRSGGDSILEFRGN